VNSYHLRKPFSDPERAQYLMDIAQILKLLPAPPARLLDAGAGSGWTSRMFAQSGYVVTGIDISPEMISLANRLCSDISGVDFAVADYELGLDLGKFDCAVIYDALHHAEDPGSAIKTIYNSLNSGGMLITIEPGRGHAAASVHIMEKYGTTEKDMEYDLQREYMLAAGFKTIKKYPRLSVLHWLDVSSLQGEEDQAIQFTGALYSLSKLGLSSVVVAIK
jgi:SAM-dependent methyltransferase